MEYYFNNITPVDFQRLINAILLARFGEDLRVTPLRGADGGRDSETAPGNPHLEVDVSSNSTHAKSPLAEPRLGRYLFQVKHHNTNEMRPSDARKKVLDEFEEELTKNVLTRHNSEKVNFFFLVTNVPSSAQALTKLDEVRSRLISGNRTLHADIWWKEQVTAYLDQMPTVWSSFPSIFAGEIVPYMAGIASKSTEPLSRAFRLAIGTQYVDESKVKFRQIQLEESLSKLFVELDVDMRYLGEETRQKLLFSMQERLRTEMLSSEETYLRNIYSNYHRHGYMLVGALQILLDESGCMPRKIILEGGPGQGKSTITQMAVQLYRQQILGKNDIDSEGRWLPPSKSRIPFRVELREFSKWISQNIDGSVEQYIAMQFKRDAAGSSLEVGDIHAVVENSRVLLVFDGLDEIGNDELRDKSINKIIDCIHRFENLLSVDLRVVLTTRPPAIAGRRENLTEFERLTITPMEAERINNYVKRWLLVQIHNSQDRKRVQHSFERRQHEPHVKALARNPMQLSVLLHYIRLKGEAFPDLRADLYGDYFQIVIDREVEKREEFLRQRRTIEALHQFIGYKIHALTEAELADGTLNRQQLLDLVEHWLDARGIEGATAQNLFKLGEERLGLIVIAKDEGEQGKYGFEVQPIREYFAAAFISDQIVGNAHQVFQVMIRHSYWREVALFLAGMRRENERADLVDRARNIDLEDELGWRMDGRSIIMQLLQEGVFSEPDHVFAGALDFILDILDHKLVGFRNEPKDFVEPLAGLLKRSNRRHKARILKLLRGYKNSNDEQILYRLFRMCYQVLTSEEFLNETIDFISDNPLLTAKVRLIWPSRWGAKVSSLSGEPKYWQGVDDNTWADAIWSVFAFRGIDSDFVLPPTLHKSLFEHFSVMPTLITRLEPNHLVITRSRSNIAILRLAQLQLLLQDVAFSQSRLRSDERSLNLVEDLCNFEALNYEGLEISCKESVEDLLNTYRNVIMHIDSGRSKREIFDGNYFNSLLPHINHPGVTSWVYLKSILNILGSVLVEDIASISPSQYRYEAIDVLRSNPDIHGILLNIQAYYETPEKYGEEDVNDDVKVSELLISSSSFYQYYYSARLYDNIPRRVHVLGHEELFDVVDIIISDIKGRPFEGVEWLTRLPITGEVVLSLIDKSGNSLIDVLSYIGDSRIRRARPIKALPAPTIRRMLKVVRTSFSKTVLTGCWIVLSNSKFIKLAGIDLVIKLMQYTNKPEMIANIFNIPPRSESSWDQAELDTLIQVAERISKDFDQFDSAIVTSAGAFLAEHYKVNMRPLTHDEEVLSIKVREL